jgi:hypothetical protein
MVVRDGSDFGFSGLAVGNLNEHIGSYVGVAGD